MYIYVCMFTIKKTIDYFKKSNNYSKLITEKIFSSLIETQHPLLYKIYWDVY